MSRPIKAILHRKDGRATKEVWVRHYSRISNAIPRATQLAILEGQPGDVVQFWHETGFEIGTAKIKVFGQLDIRWTFLEEMREKGEL